jgi:C1A family cysteine protease
MRAKLQIIVASGLALLLSFVSTSVAAQEPYMAPQPPERYRELTPRTGFIPPPVDLSHLTGSKLLKRFEALPPPPPRWDWRTQGKVTPVKSQGVCGACYAFASLGNIESKMLIDGEGIFDFSENNAKECNWYKTGCGGGNYEKLANFFSKKGTVLESCDPYVPSDVSCNSSCPYIKTLLDWRIISGDTVPATGVLKSYIYNCGPVFAVLYAGDSNDPVWESDYKSYDGSYTLYYTGSWDPNHAVLVVGWDDTLSHDGGQGAWIVKNNWGTSWGGTCGYGSEGGYFTIAYGSAQIGMYASYIEEWQNYDSDGEILYYDEAGWTSHWGYGNPTAWGLCKFVPSSTCSLTRVEFWTNDSTADLDVYIYDDFNGFSLSNLLVSKLNISYAQAGYHSVALDAPPELAAGDDVYARIKFTNASYTFPIVADHLGQHETGTTYISATGGSGTWFDLGTTGYESDVAIRVRLSSRPTLTVTSPNGGEDWALGSGQTVNWTSTGSIANVKIEYSTNGGSDWTTIVAASPDDGGHPWAVPNTPSANCLVRISDASDGDPWDQSDAPFTLSDQTPPSPVSNLETTRSDTSIILTWSPATDNIGVDHYLVFRGIRIDMIHDSLAAPSDTFYEDHQAMPGVLFYYEVFAIDSAGNAGPGTVAADSIPTGVEAQHLPNLPQSFLLMQNSPNPFNSSTQIRYFLPQAAQVKLEVYNILGRRVATLVDQKQSPGYKHVTWNASPFASGVYVYRMSAGGHTLIRKMVLLK